MKSTLTTAAVLVLALAAGQAHALPISYQGTLNTDVTRHGNVTGNGGADTAGAIAGGDWWRFSGTLGDLVTLTVNRLDAGLDPAFVVYEGIFADTDDIDLDADNVLFGIGTTSAVAFGDDELAAFPGLAGPFSDAQTSFNLPSTGSFSVLVWSFVSNGAGPFDYQVTLGTPPTGPVAGTGVPEPASLALMGLALSGLGIGRRRARR